jgi:hypothetical protein
MLRRLTLALVTTGVTAGVVLVGLAAPAGAVT